MDATRTEPGVVTYDPRSMTYRTTHRWGDTESITGRIADAVAAVSDAHPTAIEPIHARIDPDALEAAFEPVDGARRENGRISFPLHGHRVTVHGNGAVVIHPDGG